MAATGWKVLQGWLSELINGWRGNRFKEFQAHRKPKLTTAPQNPPTAPPLSLNLTTKPVACMHPMDPQTVKPHVKMITFRYGANGANATVGAATTQTPGNTDITSTQTPGNIGIKSTPVTQIHYDSNVPPRYRRLPMSEEEMEYITRGGPE